ncbi:MAG TPA: phosphatase PAP2 family protein [Bacteroidia bacterium]|jgi:membrane-associated phospholipid phosphatase|nr:phosphatase PAP2 family protein [Bacteroidia bacterium]
MYDILKKNSAFFFPYLLSLLAGTAFFMLWGKTDISLYINGHNSAFTDFFFKYWTNVGLGYLIIPVALVLAFVSFRYMLMSVFCFLVTFGINDSIKYALNTPRPGMVFDGMHQTYYHVPGVDIYSWDSFPSGHTAIAFCLFCLLALITNKSVLKFLCFICAFLIGYSRIYLAEHFLNDVIGGSVIGVACAILSYKIFTKWSAINKFANIDKPLINPKGK